ncbi:MAG: sulfatase-like hydrolase/transferase [Verrucomicrobiota bacterium]
MQTLKKLLPALAISFVAVCPLLGTENERPNILWITSEDNGPFLGCYGDPNAKTPNLDKLAEEGILYKNCFANAPVCAVARSSWIWGVPAVTTGTIHMRSKYSVPQHAFTTYPELFKQAGYYVTNNAKTDYNTNTIRLNKIWHMCGKRAHYKSRANGQPFFAIFNLTTSHESGIFPVNHKASLRVPAESIRIPAYQVATPEVIQDWRNYYNRMELMDSQVGQILKELKASGEAENTIIAYCSDHGGVTLRSKRFLHDTGTRVPLIVYFPEKWQHLAPEQPGSVSDRLVQFIDMPKTWLSLAGITPPASMPGYVFLGNQIEPGPESVFLFSGRFDESPDTSRAVTDGRWKYIRNYESDRPRFQMLRYPLRQIGQVSQYEVYKSGQANSKQAAQYEPQPAEELYDTEKDPDEVDNLVESDPQMLARMRQLLDEHIINSHDLGFMPETLMEEVNAKREQTIYDFGQSEENYPLKEVLEIATIASTGDPENLARFETGLTHPNETIRYWAAVGLRILGERAAPAKAAIEQAMLDDRASVRINAAISLGHIGERDQATTFLVEEARKAKGDVHSMWALDGLKLLDAPEAIDGIPEEELVGNGNYSKAVAEMLKAGGSTWRKPDAEL